MKVIFGYSPGSEVDSLYWKDPSTNMVTERSLRSDGVLVDKILTRPLSWVVNNLASTQFWVRVAIVDDIRTAFKYLGKSPDLVQLLPEAQIDFDE